MEIFQRKHHIRQEYVVISNGNGLVEISKEFLCLYFLQLPITAEVWKW